MTEFATITPLLRPNNLYAVNNAIRHGGGYFSIQQRLMPSFGGHTSYAQYIGPPDMPTPKKHGRYTSYRIRVRLKPAGVAAIRDARDAHLANRRHDAWLGGRA